jgi:GntR family transcriptional regulator
MIDQIRFGIASGRLEVGEQLPTVRALAVKLKVNLNTVSKAYKELEIQNIIETQQGTGTFIGTQKIILPDKERDSKLREIVNEFMLIASSYGFTVDDLIKKLKSASEG